MQMIELAALPNGGHRTQTVHGVLPEGWALVPETMTLENFPFGQPTAQLVAGTLTLTAWTPGDLPDPAPETPTRLDQLEAQALYTAMMTDTLIGA